MNFQNDFAQDPAIVNPDIDTMLKEQELKTENSTVMPSQDIDPNTQAMLNNPAENPHGFDQETISFITEVMERVYAGTINVYSSDSIINSDIYNALPEEIQGKADMLALSLCSKLRELKGLMELSGGEQLFIQPTYQASLLVQDIQYRKNEFENKYGDVFVI
jgi:hypothetical protein